MRDAEGEMRDAERLDELAALHIGGGVYACRKRGLAPVAATCDTQEAVGIGYGLLERVAELEAAIREVLADEETGTGWGPDVTMVARLQAALEGTR